MLAGMSKTTHGLYALLNLVLAAASLQAADYYVSTSGSDSNPGTAAQPFRTITSAYSHAAAGVTIHVAPGVYTDYSSTWGIHLNKSGTASSPIVLVSQVPFGAIIDRQNASDGGQGFYVDGSYNVINGFEIRNAPHGGVSIWGDGNQILYNHIHQNGTPASTSTDGRDGAYSDLTTSGNVYIGNWIDHNGRAGSNLDHGLYLCGKNEVVCNNVLFANSASGLQIAGYNTVSNMKVYNNVMAWNGVSGIIVWQAMNGVDIKNNIIYHNGHYGLSFYAATGGGVVVNNNLSYGNGYGDFSFTDGGSTASYSQAGNVFADPHLVSETATSFDAHLSSSSPAIRAGLNLYSAIATDMDGAARPTSGSWDLGVYVYGSSSSTADTIPPTVSLSAPANSATVSGSAVTVSANASDSVGVAGVQFKLDGANLGNPITAAPYSMSWNSTSTANGTHTLTAVASDAAGNQTTATISVNVNNLSLAPTVTLTSPANGASFTAPATINLAASVTANGHTITQVQFYNGSSLLGVSASAPYSFALGNVSAGSYALSAKAVYDSGSSVASSSANVTVSAPTASTNLTFASTSGTISAPFVINSGAIMQAANTGVTAGGQAIYTFNISVAGDYVVSALVNAPSTDNNSLFVNIDAQPTDPTMIWDIPVTTGFASQTVSWRGTGTVSSTSASGLTAQYGPKVFSLTAGTHQLIIRGRESNVQVGTITIARSGLNTPPPPPTVSLTSPATGASFTAPATINLAASVTANGHTISQVQFYNGSSLLGIATSAPYSFTWSNVSAGNYALSARAVYDSGSSVASPSANVTVSAPAASTNLTFASTSGTISAPFVVNSGAIMQAANTSVTAGGQAIYTFNISVAGNYVVSALVNAPSTDNNSLFINIDAQPTDPTMIWDIPVTTGFASRTVSWRGTGTVSSTSASGLTAQYGPKVFSLSAGTHQLIVRGRESNVQLGTFTIAPSN